MKTSFYFVLWILIYPILGLFNNSFIDNSAFIVAFAIVLGAVIATQPHHARHSDL